MQQCEDLANKLTISEQESRRKSLELEIKENLLQGKDNYLSEQEQQLRDYQLLLRQSDEHLTKCQKIITDKSDQLENLEEEKNSLAELLTQTGTKISELESDSSLQKTFNKGLESSLTNSHKRVSELESKIKELEKNNPQASELVKLKQELTQLKDNSQKEKNLLEAQIKDLKSQLQSARLKEKALNNQIQALTSSKVKEVNAEEVSDKSYWERIKTPLIFVGGILALISIVGYFKSKSKS